MTTTASIITTITAARLRGWGACRDGYDWFVAAHPDGGEYADVMRSLRAESRHGWCAWLSARVWGDAISAPADLGGFVTSEVADALAGVAGSPNSSSGTSSTAASSGDSSTAASSGYYSTAASSGTSSTAASSGTSSKAASSGDSSTAASSGYYSTAASSGTSSKAASSGYSSTAASSGDSSTAASSGTSSTAASSGDSSTAASSGYYSTAASSGKHTISMVAGLHGKAKAGADGCIALCWHDGARNRITVGYVGEDGIKPDTFYRLDDAGHLVLS